MLLLRKESLPDGPAWLIELKFDGYRALADQDRRQGSTPLAQ
jgi:ATP-dependent DNA ligase